jgi:hypothetical protein
MKPKLYTSWKQNIAEPKFYVGQLLVNSDLRNAKQNWNDYRIFIYLKLDVYTVQVENQR